MGLQHFWFIVVAVLFLGFFVLEGFDFGVGMLMEWLGRRSAATAAGSVESHRRAVLNTIGPVWDGNEVWLITAGGAMFAAFPNWYATVFSGLYLPLLAILLSMIARVVAIEWRGKINDPKWRTWCDIGIAAGSWVPAILWGVALRFLCRVYRSVRIRTWSDCRSPMCLTPTRCWVAWPRARCSCSTARFPRAQDRRRGAHRRRPAGEGAEHPRDSADRGIRSVDPIGPWQTLDLGGTAGRGARAAGRSRRGGEGSRRLGVSVHDGGGGRGGDPAVRLALSRSGALDHRPGI